LEDEIKKAIEWWRSLDDAEKQAYLDQGFTPPVDPGLVRVLNTHIRWTLLISKPKYTLNCRNGGRRCKKGIRFGVEAAYFGALLARDNRLLAEAAVERQKDLLRIAEARYKVGAVAKTEVLDAQVQLAKAEANLSNVKSQEEKAYINLKKLLGCLWTDK